MLKKLFAIALLYDAVMTFGAIRGDKYEEYVTSDWA